MVVLRDDPRIPTLIRIRSIEDSLKSQDLWNKAMQQKVGYMMDSIDTARKEVAALKEKVRML